MLLAFFSLSLFQFFFGSQMQKCWPEMFAFLGTKKNSCFSKSRHTFSLNCGINDSHSLSLNLIYKVILLSWLNIDWSVKWQVFVLCRVLCLYSNDYYKSYFLTVECAYHLFQWFLLYMYTFKSDFGEFLV